MTAHSSPQSLMSVDHTEVSDNHCSSRRSFLSHSAGGLSGIALAMLFSGESPAAAEGSRLPLHRPRAKRIVQLFMNGGASQMDLFDYRPELNKRHGEKFDPGDGSRVEAPTSEPGKLMKSPFPFRQHGECGRWVSNQFPHLANCVDDIAFLLAMQSRTNVHGPASFLMNTGFLLPGFPSLGAWVSYSLGSLSENLPVFIVLPDPRGLPYNNRGNFTSGFLSVTHSGTVINTAAADPINDIRPPTSAKYITQPSEREGLSLLRSLNAEHAANRPGDSRLEARIASYELAARMQLAAPEAFDVSGETAATQQLYGMHEPVTADYGKRCLLARRLLERGVRFVQVWSGAGGASNNWDNHTDIIGELPKMTTATDKPIAGLLHDLKARGMLEDTLVVWSTEFGRMPFTQGATGRDHNGGTGIGWLAGGGVKPGVAYGESDLWSWKAAHNKTTNYDLHATILHLLGLEHERLTYRHNGADRRLTDVHGRVIAEVLA